MKMREKQTNKVRKKELYVRTASPNENELKSCEVNDVK